MSPENLLEYVLLSPDEDGFEFVGKIVLGSSFDNVVRQADEMLLTTDEARFDVEIEDLAIAQHQRLIPISQSNSTELATASNQIAQTGSIDIEFSLKAADGIPVEVVIDGTPLGLRTAVVSLPEVSGVRRVVDSRNVQIVWDPKSSELKVRLAGILFDDKRLWVRIALGESGDLLAVDRAKVQSDGSAVSSSVVPPVGEIGELYVDVTDSPTEIIGSSRFRVRRRAARLEAFAADLEKGGQTDQASAVRLKAQSLRSSLGEDSGDVSLTNIKQKPTKWWIVALLAVLIGLFAGWVMRGGGSDPAATLINSTTTLVQESSTSVVIVQPSDQSLIAYRPGAIRFFGEGNVNLAAEIEDIGEDSAAVRVQIYDQYERSLGQSTPSTEQSLMQTCEVRIGTDTGSGGGSYAIQTRIAAYTAGSYEDAQLLLTETDLGEPDAEYAGAVAMTANIIESCEVRRVIDQDAVIEIARSAFEAITLDIPLNANETFVVLRIINERGSSVSWTSTDVLKIEK